MKRRARTGFLRLLTVILGAALALALVEAAMRSAASLILLAQSRSNPKADLRDPDEFRIVALGESTTAQFWAEGRDTSWPGQLERMLNDAALGRRFKVINLARGGASSAFQVAAFEEQLDELRPHAVISMMGINDFVPYEFLGAGGWRSLRTVKLATWLYRKWTSAAPRTVKSEDRARIIAAVERELAGVEAASPRSIQAARRKVDAFAAAQGDDEWFALGQAGHLFLLATRKNAARAADRTMQARKELLASACFDLIARGLEKNPTDSDTASDLGYAVNVAGREQDAFAILRRAVDRGLQPDQTLLTMLPRFALGDPRLLAALRERGLGAADNDSRRWYAKTVRNYRRLADTARARGIVYLAMQYPTGKVESIQNIFSANPDFSCESFVHSLYGTYRHLEILPEYKDILYIGNEIFDSLASSEGYDAYFKDRFTAANNGRFGHTTTKGSSVVARNAASVIRERWAEIARRAPRYRSDPDG